MQRPPVFWKMYTLKSKTLIIKSIKHDIRSVSKSVAWYQQYLHIKACLSTGYIQTVWRQVKVTFIPVPGKVNYTQSKAYCAISLLSFMQKTMEKLVTKNINNKILGHAPTFIITGKSTETATHHVETHIQGAAENRKLYLSILRYWGSFKQHCMWHYKGCLWHGLGDTF